MNEMFFLAVGVLFLMAAWRANRKTSLDEARDKLFDLREDLRDAFLAHGRCLDDRAYLELRQLLNAQIRFAEDLRFVGMLYMVQKVQPDMTQRLLAGLENRLQTDDPELNHIIARTRHKASRALQTYMLFTSFSVFVSITPIVAFTLLQVAHIGIRHITSHLRDRIASRLDRYRECSPSALEAAALMQPA